MERGREGGWEGGISRMDGVEQITKIEMKSLRLTG